MTRGMNLVVVMAALLLLGGVVLAQSNGPVSSPQVVAVEGRALGGDYQLTSLTWQVSGTASGGRYQLLCPAATTLRGSGCCCTYLPGILRAMP